MSAYVILIVSNDSKTHTHPDERKGTRTAFDLYHVFDSHTNENHALSLSASLSVIHTQTHTHTHTDLNNCVVFDFVVNLMLH